MKKVLCVIAAVAMVAVFGTSCSKDCTCKTYQGNSQVASITYSADKMKEAGLKCADMSSTVGDIKVECK